MFPLTGWLPVVPALLLVLSACAPQRAAAPEPQPAQPQAAGAKTEYPTMTLKFNHVVARDTPKGKAADKFAALVKQKSGGKIDVQVFPNSELYKDGEELEALQQGAIHFIAPGTDKLGVLIPAWEAPVLPGIFLSEEAGDKFVEPGNAVAKELLEKLREKGLLGLNVWLNGFKHFTSSKRALINPDDFKGQKFRTSGKPDEAFVKALGASAQVMAFSEVFGALQQGVVDGQFNTPSNIVTQKFHEVQKYGTVSRGGVILLYAVATNAKWFDSQTPEVKKLLSEAMDEATRFNNKVAADDNKAGWAAIKASGRLELREQTEAEAKAWAVAGDQVLKEWEARTGKEIIEKLKALNNKG
ncbi:MAG: DctP family TRAP transporter solute-binding subunit [Dehalococcoidia bacterium]|nr:DctP family TRAP transporter solute-binding subunit [Dehalococcoidia bacterium]